MAGHQLPPAGPFAADDGAADPALAAALAAYAAGTGDLYALQRALLGARVLVPVVAADDERDVTAAGPTGERSAQLAMVTVTGRDGRRALPVFTCLDSIAAWDATARPVPLTAGDVARGAYAEGASALLVDLGRPGPNGPAVLEGPALLALAEDRPWLPPLDDPDVVVAIRRALVDLPGLAGLELGPSPEADLRLTLSVAPAATGDGPDSSNGADGSDELVRHVAQAAASRLADVDLLRARLSRGLDVAVVRP